MPPLTREEKHRKEGLQVVLHCAMAKEEQLLDFCHCAGSQPWTTDFKRGGAWKREMEATSGSTPVLGIGPHGNSEKLH